MRGDNLKVGKRDGDRGRVLGGRARAAKVNNQLRDFPCSQCDTMGYTTLSQHWGHLGFRAVMEGNPTALSSLKDKIKRTGRADSRARWKAVSA